MPKSDGADNISCSYDQRNRLTQESTNGIITTYRYDNNGNLTAESDGTQFTYDAFNRLVETNKPDGTWQQNVYDALGLRMATVENGGYTEYTFDRGSIIADYDKEEDRKTRHIRGYNLISQKGEEGEAHYCLHNAHGDITKLVDSAGNVQNSYSYDAFGNTTSYTEKVENRFRYAGEQYDSIGKLYYLRARYYAPAMGRFINEDTYRGQIEDPSTQNLYTYCLNNPIIYIDPSGHRVEGDGGGKSKCGSGKDNKGTGKEKWTIAQPILDIADFLGNTFLESITFGKVGTDELGALALNMYKDKNGVYHARTSAWQQIGGYNNLYDYIFDVGTSMATAKFEFTDDGGRDYILWAWKGDYINLGAEAELGIYSRDSGFLGAVDVSTPHDDHWLIDTSLAMPMTMTLKEGNTVIANYTPSESQWWITSFNPEYKNRKASQLSVKYTVDFTGNEAMYNAFLKSRDYKSHKDMWSFPSEDNKYLMQLEF